MLQITSLRRKLKLTLLLLLPLIALSACIGQQPVFLNASDCSSLIPNDWKIGQVESAPLPQQNTAGALATFGIAQTGQLDKSNDRTHDTITIYQNCETLLKKAAKEIEPKPWYQFW